VIQQLAKKNICVAYYFVNEQLAPFVVVVGENPCLNTIVSMYV
jgi:hypothetical protein